MLRTEPYTKLGCCLALRETDIFSFDLSVSSNGRSYHVVKLDPMKRSFSIFTSITYANRIIQFSYF